MTATRLHLVRHGQVENPRRIVYGHQPGWRLSAEGRRQAAAAAARLRASPIAHVYTSPLDRARETADAIAAATGAAVSVEPAVVESALGAYWEGLPWTEVKTARRREWETYLHRPHEVDFVPETFAALAERMTAALRRIADAHAGAEAAVVSHGDPIKAALCALAGVPIARIHEFKVPTGSVVAVDMDARGARIAGRWAPPRRP